MASIRSSRRKGYWEVRYRSRDGVERTKGGFSTKSDAKAFRAELECSLNRGTWKNPSKGRETVAEWAERYLTDAHHKRASTLHRDRASLNAYVLPVIGQYQMSAVTSDDIRAVIAKMSLSLAPSTIRVTYGTIRHMFKTAVEADVIPISPVVGISRPKEVPTEKRFLGLDELYRLADAIDPEYRAFVFVCGVLGLRISEAAGLTVRSIDFMHKRLTVSQTISEVAGVVSIEDVKTRASRRTLPIPEFVMAELVAHFKGRGASGDDWVFPSPQGGPLRYSRFHQKVWKPAVQASDLPGLTIHGLRHTAAGLMVEAKAHPKVMQLRMGHSSITTTLNTYGHVLETVDDGLTASLDALFQGVCGADVVQGSVQS